ALASLPTAAIAVKFSQNLKPAFPQIWYNQRFHLRLITRPSARAYKAIQNSLAGAQFLTQKESTDLINYSRFAEKRELKRRCQELHIFNITAVIRWSLKLTSVSNSYSII
ncbi:unnamed protein product, partial [Allacma fusca]